jgi:glycosyltransferase involved in cell wall biosynthesis
VQPLNPSPSLRQQPSNFALSSLPHIIQVTPTSYSRAGVIGGGERLALYLDEALRQAAAQATLSLTTTLLALDGPEPADADKDHYQWITGRAWDVHTLDANELIARLRPADIVYVHQCLTRVGLFAAAHAKLLGIRVYGSDAGAGEAHELQHNRDLISVYDGVHALSSFAASAFAGFSTPVRVIPGPIDTNLHRPPPKGAPPRDQRLVASVGRILPHKGHERTIRALPTGMSLIIVGQHYDQEYLAFLQDCAAAKDVSFENEFDDAQVRALLHRAGTLVHASTHTDYAGRYAHKPELLGLVPLEALASGAPTLVSDAACLPELAVVPGCRVFRDDMELATMLREVATGRTPYIAPAAMHAAVEARFGLAAAGSSLLDMMRLGTLCVS